MAIEITIRKSGLGLEVHPDCVGFMDEIKERCNYKAKLTIDRSVGYNRKFHKMIRYAFDRWDVDAGETFDGVPVTKDYDYFLDRIVVMAGHYVQVFNFDGSFELRRKKINFSDTDQHEFEQVARDCSQVIIDKILPNMTLEQFLEVSGIFM